MSTSMRGGHPLRARWIGLRYDTQPDGSRLVVGVCHAHHTPRGCPGHALALRYLNDAAACCVVCGAAVAKSDAGQQEGAKYGSAVLDAAGEVTGWMCVGCKTQVRRAAG